MNLDKLKQKKTTKELLEFGIINMNKPENMTSFDVVDSVRKNLKLRKTSHFGTLDPMVTGVLPIALNRACKLTGFFLGEDKEYKGIMRIHKEIPLEEIRKTIQEKFLGKIMQKPPVRSRVKRQEREREIKKFVLLGKQNKDIEFETEVQGGTYIRKLIDDLGKSLGIGAHMLSLRRIRAGIFREKESINSNDFRKAAEEYEKGNDKLLREIIIPAEIISEVYPIVKIRKECLSKIFHGSPLHDSFLEEKKKFEKKQIVCVFEHDNFIGMYRVANERKVFARPEFVLQPI